VKVTKRTKGEGARCDAQRPREHHSNHDADAWTIRMSNEKSLHHLHLGWRLGMTMRFPTRSKPRRQTRDSKLVWLSVMTSTLSTLSVLSSRRRVPRCGKKSSWYTNQIRNTWLVYTDAKATRHFGRGYAACLVAAWPCFCRKRYAQTTRVLGSPHRPKGPDYAFCEPPKVEWERIRRIRPTFFLSRTLNHVTSWARSPRHALGPTIFLSLWTISRYSINLFQCVAKKGPLSISVVSPPS